MCRRVVKVILILILGVVILYGYYFLNLQYGFSVPCYFKKLTGYCCPGCGITRCLFSIIKGDFYQAYCYNRLVFILLPFMILDIFYKIYLYVFDTKDNIIKKIPNIIYMFLLVGVIMFGVIRNII